MTTASEYGHNLFLESRWRTKTLGLEDFRTHLAGCLPGQSQLRVWLLYTESDQLFAHRERVTPIAVILDI